MNNNQKKPNKKILLVEDDNSLRNVLKDKLEYVGFSVGTATDGAEGLKVSLKEKPDLILLDVIMPKMNGMEMLKELRQDSWGKAVPVILLSNDDDPSHIRETLKDNATDYLVKADWELNDVIRKIKNTLGL